MLKDTIISAFNYDGTLLKWLKKVEDALKNASASEFRVNKKGNATISFSIVFANGDTLESGDIILQQGESVTGATIRQGHLILTLSNGNELDAGDLGAVTGFSINESQHLIITYQNGTTQDLGAIFTGNVNIDGNFTANSIIENMSGYSFSPTYPTNFDIENLYVSAVKNGNKLTLVYACFMTKHEGGGNAVSLGNYVIPSAVASKIIPFSLDGNLITARGVINIGASYNTSGLNIPYWMQKGYNQLFLGVNTTSLVLDTKYYFRHEITYLLSDNLIA